jgi:hypothetical protein
MRVKLAAASLLLVARALGAEIPTEGLLFFETFDDGQALESGRWVKSSHERYAQQELEIVGYDSVAENITGSYEVRGGVACFRQGMRLVR